MEDAELMYTMSQDSYWEPPTPQRTPRAVTLPLSNYKSGSYYSYNGKKCTCHNSCDVPPASIPTGVSAGRCYVAPTSNGNCLRYVPTGSIQCKGFADYVFKQYTGNDISKDNAYSKYPSSITNDKDGQTLVKNFFKNVTVGSNIRFNAGDYRHSVIITGVTDKGISIYDCNGAWDSQAQTIDYCKVRIATWQWADVTRRYKAVVAAWKA